ncbi:hypothetical protein BCON_0300g00030 [Botryotinia convoluta]|uniref:Uncharacterized protein n=1 Tax=Botryotinia convoluta TaxID=54673 RepID=A0A4Z1HPP0_9HELO|nr:hypothetical protein BCON_0300g00030 [Botryotinia convoluta]
MQGFEHIPLLELQGGSKGFAHPTKYTTSLFNMTTTPDSNNDFKFATRGLIRALEDPHIYSDPSPTDDQQNIVWDTKAYDILAEGCPDIAKAAL